MSNIGFCNLKPLVMIKIKLLLILLIFSFSTFAQQSPLYHRAKIYTGKNGLTALSSLGLCVDHGEIKKDVWIISDFSEVELQKAKNAGFNYDVLIANVTNFYQHQNDFITAKTQSPQSAQCNDITANFPYAVPAHFHLGSMGGFFTYSEVLQILDSMSLLYPALITNKAPISLTKQTVEGRDIYYLKITSNVKPDNQKPKILYNALHHAREACSISQLIYFMWYVLENYETDTRVTSLVDNLQMYFVPVVNPDGYLYNQQTNSNGGGMWRKNRAVNGNNAFGVDLNRNYSYQWGYDNAGSSNDPTNDTYRGPAKASEPETQMMSDFINDNAFYSSINYHTYSNLLIYPWGYINAQCPDSNLFRAQCKYMSAENGFAYGNPVETVGYSANGSIDDWLYADTSHAKIYTITPEAGAASDGFWPAINRIVPICQNTFIQNIKFAELALDLITFKNKQSIYLDQLCTYVKFNVQRLGFKQGSSTVSFTPISVNILTVGNATSYNSLQLLQNVDDSIEVCLNSSVNPGDQVVLLVNTAYANHTERDTLKFVYGAPTSVFASNGSSVNGFTASAGSTWGISTQKYVSSPSSITDSPNGSYANNKTTTLTTTNAISLANTQQASLSFYTQWDIEAGYDFAQVQVSANNGSTWSALCGKYTHAGSANQDNGQPLYDGTQTAWVKEEMSLNNYIGQTILIRFRLKSDGYVNADGFYFDDLAVNAIGSASGYKIVPSFNTVSIYPNPANTRLTIESSLLNANYNIYNTVGQQVASGTTNQTKTELDIQNLPEGIYYLKVHDASGNYTYFDKVSIIR